MTETIDASAVFEVPELPSTDHLRDEITAEVERMREVERGLLARRAECLAQIDEALGTVRGRIRSLNRSHDALADRRRRRGPVDPAKAAGPKVIEGVIETLRLRGPLAQTEIASAVGVNRGSISYAIKHLRNEVRIVETGERKGASKVYAIKGTDRRGHRARPGSDGYEEAVNYQEARALTDGGGWHMTIRNDDMIWTHSCCRERVPATAEDVERLDWIYHGRLKVGDLIDGDPHAPHATREEAEECYHAWRLAGIEESLAFEDAVFDGWMGCEARIAEDGGTSSHPCDQPTKGGARYRDDHRPEVIALCSEHRSPSFVLDRVKPVTARIYS
jgi:hypothetical protein